MHDPDTLILSLGPLTLWHHDPCKGGRGDDSCGWFMRAHHGKPEVLKAIKHRLDFCFDRTWTSYASNDHGMTDEQHRLAGHKPERVYDCGLFRPNGDPHFSVHGIVLNMFSAGAWCHFKDKHGSNDAAWRISTRWLQEHLAEILLFAENPTDSLYDGITGKFRIACGEKWDREEALSNYASCVYGWILRSERPWYRHPRWHIHHWRISCRPFWRRQRNCDSAKNASPN